MITALKIVAILLSWLCFYKILVVRNKNFPKLKATIITMLFASLILATSTKMYQKVARSLSNNPTVTTTPKSPQPPAPGGPQ